MSGANGSTKLTPEQQQWFKDNVGVRYLHVQANADRPNRKQRRRRAK